MTTSIFTRKFNSSSLYVRSRYAILCLKEAKKEGYEYVYYNGGQGMMFGIANNNFTKTRDQAIIDCSSDNNVSYDEVDNDYHNWYYLMLIDEAIESLQSDCDYEKKYF